MILQIVVKVINNTIRPNRLVPTLLVFRAYPYITRLSTPSTFIVKRAKAVRLAMTKLRHLNAKRQIRDTLTIRNSLNIVGTLNLLL